MERTGHKHRTRTKLHAGPPFIKTLALIMAEISYAKAFLEHWGATVEEIATSDSEQPDFLASIDACVLLIEEKTKVDNPASLAKRDRRR